MISFAKQMDHVQYIRKTRGMTDAYLRYVIDDAREAISAQPDGVNAGYYADEINYCSMELFRREKNN